MPTKLSTAKGVSNTTAASWGATSGATSPTAGNLLILAVACQNNSSATNSCSTPTGWTAGPTKIVSNGTARAFVALFYKIAAGSDSVPTFTITGSNTTVTILEEWSGLPASSPVDITFSTGTAAQIGTGTVHAGPDSTTNAADWVYAAMGGRGGSLTSWGGGQSSDDSTSASSAQLWTSTQTLSSTGSIDPQATINAGIVSIVAIAFKQATGSTVSGTATGSLGGVAGAATGTRTEAGTASGSLGGVAGAASGVRSDIGSAAGSLGGIDGHAVPGGTAIGSATGALGAIAGAAAGIRFDLGTATGTLGALTGTASGIRVDVGSATGTLGSIDGAATGTASGTPVVITQPFFDFIDYDVLAGSVTTPVVLGADHIQWGLLVFEGECQGGDAP